MLQAQENNSEAKILTDRTVLVLGGTGAMGVYLVPELAAMGYEVKVVSADDAVSSDPKVSYVKADAKNSEIMKELLKGKFDAIVDFMIYGTEEFRGKHELLLQSTAHYLFLSSYRVYNETVPITEESPRLLDTSKDKEFLATEDYSLYKAREEDILQSSTFDNWTIIRPAITYSKRRFQLTTLEAHVVVARAMKGLPIVIPREALSVQATMSWAGDVAKMIARLLCNPAALRERFTLATAEHRSWGEIAEYYKEIIGLHYVPADTEDYLKIMGGSHYARYQLQYDRLFERVVDNSKILKITGLVQEELMPLRKGLEKELSALPKDMVWQDASGIGKEMDDYVRRHG
ncbi:MAG: NAD-dependent epimerase/dehydratase family protein [Spirochaetota bacterium]